MTANKHKFIQQLHEQVYIEDYAAEGKCVARINGEVVFIEGNVAPGDTATIRIYKRKKNLSEATVVSIQEASALRTDPVCSHFGVCGGCKWQHLQYSAQLQFKTKQVHDALQRIAKVDFPSINPILGSAECYYYRNKLEFTFSKNRWLSQEEMRSEETFNRNTLGFHIPKRFDRILDIDQCYLQPEPSNSIRTALKTYCQTKGWEHYDQVKQEGFVRNLVIRTANTGDVMVIFIFARSEMDKIQEAMAFLVEQFPQISSLYYIINTKHNDAYLDLQPVLAHGKAAIIEEMEGLRFNVGPKSFYQTNAQQAFTLYKVAREMAQLTGRELVYDLYTGTGTIANFVALKARHVVGIEYVEEAIADAKANAQLNQLSNTSFYAGDMKKLLTQAFIQQQGKPDVIITDPPRAGMDKEVVDAILGAEPQRIVYVSCNPATQARDVALLDAAYQIKEVQPVDMFPHTHHVENVLLLEKR